MPFDAALPETRSHWVLRRDPAEGEATWLRVHPPVAHQAGPSDNVALYRVELLAGGEPYGSLWGVRPRAAGTPQLEESRLMATAGDQVAQSLRRQRLAEAAAELEIARRSDELKSALLDSVSHDLRTPLATMRAAAGTLADPSVMISEPERVRLGQAIDMEAERLNRLVGNLLDMSRVDSGALKPELEVLPSRPSSIRSLSGWERRRVGGTSRWMSRTTAGPMGRLGHARPGTHQSAGERGQVRRSGCRDSGGGPRDGGPADALSDSGGRRERCTG